MKTHTPYLGKHTTISYLAPSEWKKIPYLKDNQGLLPPLIITAGDSRRVERACGALNLKNIVRLHEEGERLLGIKGRGRVDMIIGTYTHNGRDIPLLIVETQMGMSATEIIVREIISHCSTKYVFGKKGIAVDGIYLIRAGTAGGINNKDGSGEKLNVGDIVNSTFSIGWSGVLTQSLAGLDPSSAEVLDVFRKRWVKAGNSFTSDNKYPLAKSSPKLIAAIDKAADGAGVTKYNGGNFSKDSLYAELDQEAFMELRRKYNVMTTEMEQMAAAKLVGDFELIGISLHAGLVSGILGVLPGESFAGAGRQKKRAEKVEENSLKIAACALWHIVNT